jgi:hypothetical protein
MMARLFMIAMVMGIAIGLPYLAEQMSAGSAAPAVPPPAQPAATGSMAPAPTTNPPSSSSATLNSPGSLVYANSAQLEGTRFTSVDQVLRFDLTKDWVYRNWARKSTGPTDVGLFAVRVPLVTGTQIAALAGSLTYFFNAQGQLEHISFRGRTGDSTPLVDFLVRTYGLQRVGAPIGEQLYQVKNGSRVQSELRTRPESVLWTTSPHSSIAVELELARPGSKRFLPPKASNLGIPPVESPTPTPKEDATANSGSYLDTIRSATPQEEGQVLWKRWPN